jgi:hypothetical protein
MEDAYITYRRFNDMALARQTAQALTDSGIANTIADGTKYFDVSFAQNSFAADINLKLLPQDFTRADLVLENLFAPVPGEVDKDYYLRSFTDQELSDIIAKPDEWGDFDYQLAKQLLQQRGKVINEQDIKMMQFRRLNELAEPEHVNDIWIVLGYAASIVGGLFGILGGFTGIIIAWALAWKKTLPDGQQVYAYDDQSRKHGKAMMIIGVISSLYWIGLRLWLLTRWL